MALSKIIAEGVDLTDTFAFTGTVTGAGLGSPFPNTVAVTSEGGAATTNLVQGLTKHWLTYNASQVAIDSFNNSSITDIGVGNHRFNFTNNFNANKAYTTVGISTLSSDMSASFPYVRTIQPIQENDILTSSVECTVLYMNVWQYGHNGLSDNSWNCVNSQGDLA